MPYASAAYLTVCCCSLSEDAERMLGSLSRSLTTFILKSTLCFPKPLSSDNPKFRPQEQFGELFHNSLDYFLYRTASVAVEYLGFRIEVYSTSSNEMVATGYALPSALQDTFGKSSVPLLTKKGLPVGKIYFGYLFVRPIRMPHKPQSMVASYSKHWKKRTTLEVGHRGMGNSYTKCAVARENTLHSLNSAAKNGADLVEFDVHLTKDKIAVVFHDFHVMVSVAKRSPSVASDSNNSGGGMADGDKKSVDFYQLAVKDLKLNQLRLLHLDHVKHQDNDSDSSVECETPVVHQVTGSHDEAKEHRPFPTLVEAFTTVADEVGFNVEIKYPMLQVDGVNECDNYFERNLFLDIILADVINHAGKRRIVFSSFDPDICNMVTLKQNKYPVLFLCLGHDTKHIPFVDERARTSMTAVKFAVGTGLIGVNFNSEDLLRESAPISKAREYGLISFVWGDELMDKKNVDYFKKVLLVDGVIYDRIGEGESRNNVFTLEKQLKAALFSKKLTSPTTPRSNSIAHLRDDMNGIRHHHSDNDPFSEPVNYLTAGNGTKGASGLFSSSMEWPQQHRHHNNYNDFPPKMVRRHNSSMSSVIGAQLAKNRVASPVASPVAITGNSDDAVRSNTSSEDGESNGQNGQSNGFHADRPTVQ